MRLNGPRLVIAGLSGDSGKTLVALGLARALREAGLVVHGFKKGPDFIDAGWLAAATGRPCGNLDTFMMPAAALGTSLEAAADADIVIVEGNRGLYDGVDAEGTHSTAGLARRLGAPVILVVDTTKVTSTVGALVLGCRAADPELNLAGVVLNRVATRRQEDVIRAAVARLAGVPVVGAIPRLTGGGPLPGRHLGLVTAAEHDDREGALAAAGAAVASHVDLAALREIAARAPAVELQVLPAITAAEGRTVRVGVLRDEAFTFTYPENLERLRAGGAAIVDVSTRDPGTLSGLDALLIGGGFPEVHVSRLAEGAAFAAALRGAVAGGLPVYAECGGLMLLARELVVNGVAYPMTAVLDLVVEQTSRPQGHGYEVAVVDRRNWLFAPGTELVGHEFHYSRVVAGGDGGRTVLDVRRGRGIDGRDGIVSGNVWASYLHLHALATPSWAAGLLAAARRYAAGRAEARVSWA